MVLATYFVERFDKGDWRALFMATNTGLIEFEWSRLPFYFETIGRWIGKYNRLYLFNNLIYQYVPLEIFAAEINRRLEGMNLTKRSEYKTNKAEEAYKQLYDLHYVPDVDLNASVDVIPFKNGFYNWRVKCFWDLASGIEFSDWYFTDTLQVEYVPDAPHPGFDRILEKLCSNEADRLEICKFFAYTMLCEPNNQRYHQLWWGTGNNGKSQLAENWAILLGDLASFIGFNRLLTDTHAAVGLRGKHLNVCSEISSIMLNSSALDCAKSITTDRFLPGRDLYESQSNAKAVNYCRQLITTNELPYSEWLLQDRAFFSRWHLIHMEYTWNKNDWLDYLDEKGSSKHVFEKIFKDEGPAIVSYILKFVEKVGELDVNTDNTKEAWLTAGNSCIAFLHSSAVNDEGETEKRELYNHYKEWCKRKGRSIIGYQTFFKTLKNRGYTQISRWIDEGGIKTNAYYIEGVGMNALIQKKIEDVQIPEELEQS